MAELLIRIATGRGVMRISHEEAFGSLSILLAEDYLDHTETSSLEVNRPDGLRRTAARLHGCSGS